VALLLLAGAAAAEEAPSAARLMDDLMWSRGPIGTGFALTDHTGAPRSRDDFRGRLVLLYFGYTACPDVCPTDLQAIAGALDLLGEAGEGVQPVFVTIDPATDTAEHLARYVPLFHPRLLGLTGSAAEIRRVATAYKAWYRAAPDGFFEHSGFVYLLGRDGDYLGFFPPGTSAARIAEVVREFL
jgi:cytochrome oxidase Cu insertion factor (SCO1/SenC/PrrC family)